MSVHAILPSDLSALSAAARASPRLRQHRNLHTSYSDPCQRVLNAIEVDSYIQPHRHLRDPKRETLMGVRGQFALVTFDDAGDIVAVTAFGISGETAVSTLATGVEIPHDVWHTALALEPGSILLEIKAGPFNPETAKEAAPWAPEENSPGAIRYFESLRQHVNAALDASLPGLRQA